jgi:hypothetical protein
MSEDSTNTGSTILVELRPSSIQGEQQVSLQSSAAIDKSQQAFQQAMQTTRDVAHEVFETIRAIPLVERPDEITLEFGLKLTVGGNVLVANASTEAQINVVMKWNKDSVDDLSADKK